jgi:hypothetical protein
MNWPRVDWSRGLFRLWVLFAVPWVVGGVILTSVIAYDARSAVLSELRWKLTAKYTNLYALTEAELVDLAYREHYSDIPRAKFDRLVVAKVGDEKWRTVRWGVAGTFFPPLAALAAGASLLWALRGFKPAA